jgi:hypothetical protein
MLLLEYAVRMVRCTPWLLLAACRPDEVSFPARLAPLEPNRAEWPDAAEEGLAVVSGGDSDLWWAHSRGYVHAPPALVWAALADPAVVVDRREVDVWEVTPDVLDFDRSWLTHHVVEDVLTVDYDLTWAWEVQAGTDALPERVVAQWEKTAGTPFIDVLSGSIVLEGHPDDPSITALSVVEHLKASLRDDETITAYLRDLHTSVVAASHGEPLPRW